ncbi:DUF7507 domain-containing protein [Clostridium sp. B9]|uniref:DUF7507 domain-containing protein n=1 Tax=Clostridium sp. B9 TaxID=3423224 RepID=UPI003D2F4750
MALNAIEYTIPLSVLNNTGLTANLYAWLDFNRNGVFQTNEGITQLVLPSPVSQILNLKFNLPTGVSLNAGPTIIRARLTTENLINTGGITAEDTRSFGVANDGEVEDYQLIIEDTRINGIKSVDKAFIDLNGILTYNVSLINTGTLPIDNFIFKDQVPVGTTYANALFVSTTYTGTNPQSGLTITRINPGEIVTISWQVQVGSVIPTPNPISNTGEILINRLPVINTNTVRTRVNNIELTPVKSVDKIIADIGDELLYTVTINAVGSVPADNVVIIDNISTDVTYIVGSLTSNVPITGNPIDDIILVNPVNNGETIIINYKVRVDSLPISRFIDNIANITYEYILEITEPPVLATRDSNVVSTRINVAEFIGEKSVDKAFAQIGEELLYTIKFINSGNVGAQNVVIVDFIQNGTSYVGGSISGTIPFTGDPTTKIYLINPVLAGETVEISYRVVIDFIPSINPIKNVATINYNHIVEPTDPPVSESKDTNTVSTQVNDPLIQVSKSVDKNFIETNEIIEYTIDITNNGDVDASNIVIRDQFPSGLSYNVVDINSNVSFSGNPSTQVNIVNSVLPGESIFIKYRVLVDSLPLVNPISNIANIDFEYIVDPSSPPRVATEVTNTVFTQVNTAALNSTKSVDKFLVNIGDTITYTIDITNTGDVDGQNIEILDTLPIGTSYIPGSISGTVPFTGNPTSTINLTNPISPGSTASISFDLLIGATAPSEISNIATIDFEYLVDPTEPLRSGTTNTNVVRTQVNISGDTTIKGVNKAFATIGEEIDYTIIFTNINGANAENVVITDSIEFGTSYVVGSISGNVPFTGDPTTQISLTNPVLQNEVVSVSYSILVNSLPLVDPLPNSADIDYDIPPTSINETTNTVTTKINYADLSPVMSVDKSFVELKGVLLYTVTFTNLGNVDALNVIMKEFVPKYTEYLEGTVNINVPFTGSPNTSIILSNPVLQGESIFITYEVEVKEIPPTDDIVNNMTIYYAHIVDPLDTFKNRSRVSNTVVTRVNSVELEVIKNVDKAFAEVLEEITYTINITNLGNVEGNNVEILDQPPNGTSYVLGTITSNVLFSGDPNSTITLTNPILPGENIFVRYKVRVDTIPISNPISNTATIQFEEIVDSINPPISKNIVTNTVLTQINSANLNILKEVDKAFEEIGEELTYTITFTNTGDVVLQNIVVTDNIPNGTRYIPGTVWSNVVFSGNPRTSINLLNPVGVGERVIIKFMVVIDFIPSINPIENIGNIAYKYLVDPSEAIRSGNRDTNSVFTKINSVNLIGSKFVDKGFAEVGENLNYTLIFTNNGDVNISNMVITDIVPEGVSYLDGSINSNVPFTGNPLTSINLLNSIIPNEQVIIKFIFIVESIPISNPVINIASATFDYIVDPSEPIRSRTCTTNRVFTKINSPAIDTIKTVDKAYAEVGEEIEYKIKITNKGNISLRNVFLSDQIPVGAEYVLFSLKSTVPINVDRENFTATLINPILPGEEIIITYKVRVEFFPPVNPMPNTVNINYYYVVDISKPLRSGTKNTNIAFTQINFALIEPIAIVDKSFVEPGGEVEYILTFKNIGNANANNIFVTNIIPPELSYINNTVSANVNFTGDPVSGMSLVNSVVQNERIEIRFKVLSSKISGFRSLNIIPHATTTLIMSSAVKYNYFVDPLGIPRNGVVDSNLVFITIKSVDVNFVKESDKSIVGVGEEVTYTLRFRNDGDGELFNVVIKDIIQSETTYIDNSLSSNVLFMGSYPYEITLIDSLNQGKEAIIYFSVTVDSIPDGNIINNTANVEYTFFLDPEEPKITENIDSNIVSITVESAIIDTGGGEENTPILEVGGKFCFIGEFVNIGNVDAENVVIRAIIPEGFTYVEGSLEVNVEFTGDPINGIFIINPVSPGERVEFTFCLVIEEIPNPNPAEVTYIVEYEYRILSQENPIKVEIEGNKLNVFVNPVALIKECIPSEVIIGDSIIYSFLIRNTSDADVTDILFYDDLPKGIEFIEGSFNGVDGEKITGKSFNLGIKIENIPANTSKRISFKVRVIGVPCFEEFKNIGRVKFQVEFQGGIKNLETLSNLCIVSYNKIAFKQDYLDGIISLDSSMPSIKEIIDFNVDFILNSDNIESLNELTTLNNGTVIGKLLNLNGKVIMSITYISKNTISAHNFSKEFILCSQIKIPVLNECESYININMSIEDLYYKNLDDRRIFFNITYILESGI